MQNEEMCSYRGHIEEDYSAYLRPGSGYRPYAIPHVTNVKRIVDGNPDTSPPF